MVCALVPFIVVCRYLSFIHVPLQNWKENMSGPAKGWL